MFEIYSWKKISQKFLRIFWKVHHSSNYQDCQLPVPKKGFYSEGLIENILEPEDGPVSDEAFAMLSRSPINLRWENAPCQCFKSQGPSLRKNKKWTFRWPSEVEDLQEEQWLPVLSAAFVCSGLQASMSSRNSETEAPAQRVEQVRRKFCKKRWRTKKGKNGG